MKTLQNFLRMTDVKDTSCEIPVVISQVAADVRKPRNTKKIAVIALFTVLGVAVILAAILVGMYLFTQGQKEILKFTLNVDKDTKQEVTSDLNENVNKYYVQNANYDMWVVDDFNRDLQVMKIQTKTATNCYVVPLNRSATVDPSKIESPSNIHRHNATNRLYYAVTNTPISDTSFLGETAKETCKGLSVYWMYPKCSDDSYHEGHRVKRLRVDWYHYEGLEVIDGELYYVTVDIVVISR